MSEKREVALCVTCLVDQVMPEVGVATVKLLSQAGCSVTFPDAQTCCGQPFFNSGYQDEARELARRVINIFENFDAVVLPSGSCTTMIRHEYPHLFDEEWSKACSVLQEFECVGYTGLSIDAVWQFLDSKPAFYGRL